MKRKKEMLAIFAIIIIIGAGFAMAVYANVGEKANNSGLEKNRELNKEFSMTEQSSSYNIHDFRINSNEEFVIGEIIVKLKDDVMVDISKSPTGIMVTGLASIDALNEKYSVTSIEKVFKKEIPSSLSNIYKFILREETNILAVARDYEKDANVEYAEPNYIYHMCITPNDPYFDFQWALNQSSDHDIDAPEAWDIETGNESIVIAIVDTGVDWDHPDLSANIWNNKDEAIDGNDTDGNGYVDDIRGWDFVNMIIIQWMIMDMVLIVLVSLVL